jgi:hypothetical protein
MPNRSDSHIDTMLTNISVKYFQDTANFVADKVFPSVPVMKQSDRYFLYKREDWFRDDAEERAMNTESAGGDYDIDNTPTYFCKKYAYHKDVSEEDRANSDDPLTPDQDATEFVTNKILLHKENLWANTYFKAGVWGTDIVGASSKSSGHAIFWNDYANSDPISDIANAATQMAEITGQRPNTLTIGRRVYDALRQHPDIIDRIKYTQKGIVTMDLLATLFDVDRILVCNAIQNTAKKGQDAAMSFIMGNHALLTYSTPTPGLKKATAGYTFTWSGLMGSNALGGRINRFDMPQLGIGTQRIEAEWALDMKVVAKDMGIFFSGIVQ